MAESFNEQRQMLASGASHIGLNTPETLEDQIDLDDAKEALADAVKSGTISWESLKRKLELRHI